MRNRRKNMFTEIHKLQTALRRTREEYYEKKILLVLGLKLTIPVVYTYISTFLEEQLEYEAFSKTYLVLLKILSEP